MRRFRDRPVAFFRGSELPRLLTMVVMLGVLWLLVELARDPNTWNWIAPDGTASEHPNGQSADAASEVAPSDSRSDGPTDLDSEEVDAAQEEFQALSDKAPLAKEDMPSYWRLMKWEQHQSTQELMRRSDKSVTYNDLWQRPEKWRGKLIELPLHLRRTARVDEVTKNSLGKETIYEVWGWNTDSQPYWYWIVCADLPPGMPSGTSIYEEATFVGYFLKLLPYEDHQGKHLAAPLLIGRLIWHPQPSNPLARRDEWTWTWIVALGLAALFALRWAVFFNRRKVSSNQAGLGLGAPSAETVETWLEQAQRRDSEHESRDLSTD